MDHLSTCAAHESGHVVAALSLGARVVKVAAFGREGYVVHHPAETAEGNIVIPLAGAIADGIFANGECSLSSSDEALLDTAVRDWERQTGEYWGPRPRRYFEEKTKAMLWQNRQAVEYLAAVLDRARDHSFGEWELKRLLSSPGSPLNKFAHLYRHVREPEPVPVRKPSAKKLSAGRDCIADGFWEALDREFGPVRTKGGPEPRLAPGATESQRATFRRELRQFHGLKF